MGVFTPIQPHEGRTKDKGSFMTPKEFWSHLLEKKNIVLSTHVSPDGDALGSILALGQTLAKCGNNVSYLVSDEPAPNLEWLPHVDELQLYTGTLEQSKLIAEADAIVVADTNAAHRLGRVGDAIRTAVAPKYLIDHHPAPESWFDFHLVRESASSTGELVFEVIADEVDRIDEGIATLLYTAIMTDTGSFRYSNVTARVHRIIAELMERGHLVPDDIHAALYDTKSLNRLRLTGRALDKISLLHNGLVGYLALSRSFLKEARAEKGDTEGLVNQVLSIDGVLVAVFFHEIEKGTKISFRSRGDYSVTKWAQRFGGGGHRNASGAFVRSPLDEVVPKVLESAPEFLDLAEDDNQGISAEDQDYLNELLKAKT